MEEERNKYIQSMLNSSKTGTKSMKSSIKNDTVVNELPVYELPKYDPVIPELNNSNQNSVTNIDSNNIAMTIRDKIDTNINQEIRDNFEINSVANSNVISLKEEILMINLLNNEINGNYIISINYKGNSKIENIKKVEFVACFMGKNLVEKNNQLKNHSIIFKIDEFQNNIYISGVNLWDFVNVFLKKKVIITITQMKTKHLEFILQKNH